METTAPKHLPMVMVTDRSDRAHPTFALRSVERITTDPDGVTLHGAFIQCEVSWDENPAAGHARGKRDDERREAHAAEFDRMSGIGGSVRLSHDWRVDVSAGEPAR